MKKYSDVELQILKKSGRKGLLAFYKKFRKLTNSNPPRVVESKKFKSKYKKFDLDT